MNAIAGVVIPHLVAVALGTIPQVRRRFQPLISVLSALISLGFAVAVALTKESVKVLFFDWAFGIKFGINLGDHNRAVVLLVSAISLAVQFYSFGYMKEKAGSLARYYFLHSLFAFSMLMLVLSPNLIQLFVFWELVGVCSYLLIAFWYSKPAPPKAGTKAFWTTRLADAFFLFAVAWLFVQGKTSLPPQYEIPLWAQLFFVIGAIGKSAQVPLHIWLPDAMEGPTPVSALLHSATMVTAGAFLISVIQGALDSQIVYFVAMTGTLSALLASILALFEWDIKRILAYSTIAQIGLMFASAGVSPSAGVFHLFTHGWFKSLLFLSAGILIHSFETNDIRRMGRASPVALAGLLVGSLSLAGFPPTGGFFSKEEVLKSLQGLPFLFAVVTVFLTPFYIFRAFFTVARAQGKKAHENVFQVVPVILLALMSFLSPAVAKATSSPPGIEPKFHLDFTLALAILGALAGYIGAGKSILPRPFSIPFERRLWFDDAFYLGLRAVRFLSFAVGWIDRYIVDGVVNAVTWLVGVSGKVARQIQSGFAHRYVMLFWIAVPLLFLAFKFDVKEIYVIGNVGWQNPFEVDEWRSPPGILTALIGITGAGAIFILLSPAKDWLIKTLATAFSSVAFAISLAIWYAYEPEEGGFQLCEFANIFGPINWNLGVDGISVALILLNAFILLTGVFSAMSIRERLKEFYVWLFLLATGVFGVFSALDLFIFFLFYELAVLPMYLLIALWGSPAKIKPEGPFARQFRELSVGSKEYSAMKLTLYLLFGSAFILAGMLWLGFRTGSFDIIRASGSVLPPIEQKILFVMFYIGFGMLAGIFPLHTWSPDGHACAPTSASMMHAGVLMKLGSYGVLRIAMSLFPDAKELFPIIGWVASVNIVWGALSAMWQKDFKYIVAYSSVSHMGVVMLGLATLTPEGVSASVFQMISHGIMTGLLFTIVGVVYDRLHTRDTTVMGGLALPMPATATAFALAGFTSLGLPGLSGFPAEFFTISGALRTNIVWAVSVIAGAFLTTLYVLSVVKNVFFGPAKQNPQDAHWNEKVTYTVLTGFLLVAGCMPWLLFSKIYPSVEKFLARF